MRRAWQVFVTSGAIAVSALCTYCSSSSSKSTATDGGTDSGPVVTNESGTGSDAGDAGAFLSLPCGSIGGLNSDAGDCTPENPICCDTFQGAQCVANATACDGIAYSCLSATDCASGQICCVGVTAGDGQGTVSCHAGTTCPAASVGSAQACQSDTECFDGGQCVTYSCAGGIYFFHECTNTQGGSALGQCTVVDGGP